MTAEKKIDVVVRIDELGLAAQRATAPVGDPATSSAIIAAYDRAATPSTVLILFDAFNRSCRENVLYAQNERVLRFVLSEAYEIARGWVGYGEPAGREPAPDVYRLDRIAAYVDSATSVAAVETLVAGLVAHMPLHTTEDAIRMLERLVDKSNEEDPVAGALLMILHDRDEAKRRMVQAETKARLVTCGVCTERYDSAVPETDSMPSTQGYGCASAMSEKNGEWFVTGYYGSRLFDMERLRFTGKTLGRRMERPATKVDPICDICIQSWLDCGIVEKHSETGPMGEEKTPATPSPAVVAAIASIPSGMKWVPAAPFIPSPCVRCGSTESPPIGETIEELYVYTAKLVRHETRLDIDIPNVKDSINGRVCSVCTPGLVKTLNRGFTT